MSPATYRSEYNAAPDIDPTELLDLAEYADWALLRMVFCVAFATLMLAAASSMVA
jgi:hypothetical protein